MARKAAQKKEVNNDGKELFEALKLLEAEKGIPVDFMIDKIKKAIATACKNSYGNEDVVIDMDPESGKFDVFLRKEIVEEVENPNREIALEIVKQLRTLGYGIPDEAVRDGLAKTVWEGRFTCLRKNPVFIIDGAHNEDAAIKLRTSIERYFKGKEIQLIMGVFQDKEYEKITSILCPLAKKVYTVELPNKARSLSAGKFAACARKYCEEAEAKDSIQSAVESAKAACGAGMNNQVIIACGSLSYLGEVKRMVEENRKIEKSE